MPLKVIFAKKESLESVSIVSTLVVMVIYDVSECLFDRGAKFI